MPPPTAADVLSLYLSRSQANQGIQERTIRFPLDSKASVAAGHGLETKLSPDPSSPVGDFGLIRPAHSRATSLARPIGPAKNPRLSGILVPQVVSEQEAKPGPPDLAVPLPQRAEARLRLAGQRGAGEEAQAAAGRLLARRGHGRARATDPHREQFVTRQTSRICHRKRLWVAPIEKGFIRLKGAQTHIVSPYAASPQDFSRLGSGLQWCDKQNGPQSHGRPGA